MVIEANRWFGWRTQENIQGSWERETGKGKEPVKCKGRSILLETLEQSEEAQPRTHPAGQMLGFSLPLPSCLIEGCSLPKVWAPLKFLVHLLQWGSSGTTAEHSHTEEGKEAGAQGRNHPVGWEIALAPGSRSCSQKLQTVLCYQILCYQKFISLSQPVPQLVQVDDFLSLVTLSSNITQIRVATWNMGRERSKVSLSTMVS